MANKTIVSLFDDFVLAQGAAQALLDAGCPPKNISLVVNDATGEYSSQIGTDVAVVKGDAFSSVGAGVGAGVALGGLGGLLVGLGAIAIPGIGPVIAAGPVVTALASAAAGAGVGAVAGGLVGALMDMGVPKEEAGFYAEGVRRGGALLTVHVADAVANQAMDIINQYQPVNIEERATQWREMGWSGFDPNATPDTTREETYRGDPTHNPNDQGWVEEEPPAEGRTDIGSPTSYTRSETNDISDQGNRGWADAKPPAEGRADIDLNRDYTADDEDDDDDYYYNTGFREHYNANYTHSGYDYDTYALAYRFGYDLANEVDVEHRSWAEIEPEAQRYWETNYRGAWDQFKDAVRHAWEETEEALGLEDSDLYESDRHRHPAETYHF